MDYVVLDTDGLSSELHPTHTIDIQANVVRYLGRPVHFPSGIQPKADSICWFTPGGPLCTRGRSKLGQYMGLEH